MEYALESDERIKVKPKANYSHISDNDKNCELLCVLKMKHSCRPEFFCTVYSLLPISQESELLKINAECLVKALTCDIFGNETRNCWIPVSVC